MPTHPLLLALLAALALETVTWLASLRRRDASVADVLWGPAFAALAWLFVSQADPLTRRGAGVAVVVTVWGLRLGWHIAARSRGRPEDPRYAAMRRTHGGRFWWVSLFTVFWLQGLILWVVALPLYAAQHGTDRFSGLHALGLICMLVGFAFEAVGDWQLARFRADPDTRGRVLDRGLWRYTRHPNYFGDALFWWGVFLTAAAAGGWWTAVSPILMTMLLMRVSGVPLLERGLAETRPGYAEYVRRTSAFVPWRPRG